MPDMKISTPNAEVADNRVSTGLTTHRASSVHDSGWDRC
jgi:hypothetical protein